MLFSNPLRSAVILLGVSSQVVFARPGCKRPPPADECAAINDIVDVLKLNGATPFCSSFLHIPASTSTATVLETATDYATLTDTVTRTTLFDATATSLSTQTEVSTVTSADSVTTTVVVVVTDDVTVVKSSYTTEIDSTAVEYSTTIT